MCNLTISSILQKTKQNTYGVNAYISLRGDEAVLNSARAHLERVLSLHDSVY